MGRRGWKAGCPLGSDRCHSFCPAGLAGDNFPAARRPFLGSPSQPEARFMSLRAFKATAHQGRCQDLIFQGKAIAMTRTLIAISVATATLLLTTLGISYVVNERCTDQMAQQGNC